MSTERTTGIVKWFSLEKGYGFIGTKTGKDVFIGAKEVRNAGLDTLHEGQQVSFIIKETTRGAHAESLLLVETSSPNRTAKSAAQEEENWSKSRKGQLDIHTDFGFGPEYLAGGYFEQKEDEKSYLRPEVLDSLAIDVAKALGGREMKAHQLRRFFNKARGIEAKLDREKDFEAIKADIYGFKRDVAYQVGRRVVPDEFRRFIERNVELAVQDEKSFRKGFLQHFESVLAYFVYYFRD
jgi:cold shock protein